MPSRSRRLMPRRLSPDRARLTILAAAALVSVAAATLAAPARPDAGASPPLPVGVAAPAPPAAPPSPNVKIVFTVQPSTKKAMVFWGKKKLGPIAPHQPLVIQRPRDSGPLDVIVKADDCIPVQTRAYTFADSKVAVKLTPLTEKNTLLGYRDELPPDGGAPASPDAGAPP
jgi:hypothetical protein